ncbi:MAG: hypothetical protein KAX64_01340 [Chromatiaceae bacterium]|nr:hypothetical protein [Chromatiaceae bacterium]
MATFDIYQDSSRFGVVESIQNNLMKSITWVPWPARPAITGHHQASDLDRWHHRQALAVGKFAPKPVAARDLSRGSSTPSLRNRTSAMRRRLQALAVRIHEGDTVEIIDHPGEDRRGYYPFFLHAALKPP